MVARIPQQKIDEIREKTDIVEIVGQYVQLKKSGKDYFGLCPFHNEKTPSFSVAEDKQIFHCFGCGKGGNVFSFIQEIDGLSFSEAVIKVAEMENIPVDNEWKAGSVLDETPENSRQRQYIQLHEKAKELFHHMLIHTKAGEEALQYLLDRGLTPDLIETFQLGFAPQQREFLLKIFENDGMNQESMQESGLFVQREDGSLADRFYQRILFPIQDFQGRTIGFSGRLLKTADFPGENQPKYLNNPETDFFNKRNVLYNFDNARATVRKEGRVFLFEGFMDVISAWQAGVKNGIASMGTSLTSQQITAIQRICQDVVLSYDGDQAGIEATNRGIELLRQNSRLNVTVVSTPEKLDPDEYRVKYGNEALKELLQHGQQTVFSFKMQYLRQNRNMQNEKEQLDYVQIVLAELVKVDSPIEQERYLMQIAQEFQLSRDTLYQQLRDLQQTYRQEERNTYRESSLGATTITVVPQKQQQPLTLVEKTERMLLYRCFNEAGVRFSLQKEEFQFVHDIYQEIYLLLDSYLMENEKFNLADFIGFLREDELKKIVTEIAYMNLSEESTAEEIQDLLHVIVKAGIADKINQKKVQLQEASQKGNRQLENDLQIEIFNLTKQYKQA